MIKIIKKISNFFNKSDFSFIFLLNLITNQYYNFKILKKIFKYNIYLININFNKFIFNK